jgi:D-lactate dehydrogenase
VRKLKIAFFEMEDWEKDYIKSQIKGRHKLLFFSERLTVQNAARVKDCQAIASFIYSVITKEILEKLPSLKIIATMSTGFDHIDLEECRKRKIFVCNVPFYGENTVAEHAFALMLALSRKIYPSIERTKKGSFELEDLRGFDLKGKTLGLIGTGHISAHVARIAYGFEMKILGYDIMQTSILEKDYGLKYVVLRELFKKSDIISLHLPLNEKTRHIINSRNLQLMKKRVIIINTARGSLIDTNALVRALQEKRIGGAGLDVLEEENTIKEEKQLLSKDFRGKVDMQTLVANHILLQFDNVIITPHNAFNSEEALHRIIDTTIENIMSFFKGRPCNVVTVKK